MSRRVVVCHEGAHALGPKANKAMRSMEVS